MLRGDAELASNAAVQTVEKRSVRHLRRCSLVMKEVQVKTSNMEKSYGTSIYESRENCVPRGKKERTPEAEHLAQLRRQLGLKQEEFAELIRVDQSTVSNWETGKAKPGRHTYIQLTELATGDLRGLLAHDGGMGYTEKPLYAQSGYTDANRIYHDLRQPDNESIVALKSPNPQRRVPNNRPEDNLPWNSELMIFAIETVTDELKKRKRKLSSRKHAELTVLFYEFCQRSGSRDVGMLGRLLMIA